jgi:autotransporter-associated beta strand protein
VNADFNIGDNADAIGTLYVRDNARLELKNLWLGKNVTCQGFVYQSGGIVTNAFAASSDWRIAGNGTTASNTVGKYFLSGGRLDLSANLQVGAYGDGEMTVSGGQVNMWTGYPVVGRFGGSTGRLIISGGEFNQLSTAQYTIIGEAGTGFLVVSNLGSLTCTNPLYIGSSNGAVGIGTAYLGSGGTITAPRIAKLNANGFGTVNLDGGTIRANASNPAYIQWLDAANVLDGGVILDSAGYDAYVPQALLGTGNGGVTKVGAGSFSLLGTNTYKGANVINGGKLALSTVSAGGGSITVADSAVLGVTVGAVGTSLASSSVTLGGATAAIDFNFSAYGNPVVAPLYATNLVLNGTVTVNVTAGNLVPATIKLITFENISGAGNLVVGALPQGMSASPLLATNGNTIEMTLLAVDPLVWKGSTDTNWDLVTTNWTVAANATRYMQPWIPGDTVRFDDSAPVEASTVNVATAVSPAAIVVDNSSFEYSLVGTGKISGPVLLTKTGTGVLRVNTANDFTGVVNITNGMLIAGNAAALGVTNGPTVVAGSGTLNVNGLNLGLEPVIASGAGFDGKGAIVNSGAAQNNALNYVTLGGDVVFGGTNRWDVRINGSTRARLSSMGNPYKLTKVSPNQVSIVAADVDPALGDIEVKEGILSFEGASTSLGDTAKTITLFTDAALQLWGATNQIAKPIVMNGHTNANLINGSGTGTIIGPITLNTDSPVSAAVNTTLILNGAIGETAPYKLTKKGAGTLVLGGTNTYSGGFVAAEGNTVVSNSFAFGTGAATVAGTTAGRIQLTADVNVTNTFVSDVNPGATGRGVLEAIGTNNATWSGPINLLAAPGAGGHLVTDAGATLTLAGPITSFNGTVLAQRSGNVVYSGGGSYTNMNLTGLALIGAHNGMATMLNLAIGVSGNSVLDLNGYNQILASLSKGGSAALVTNSSATMATLTLGRDTDNAHTVPIAGNVALVKNNVNTMTMNAVNTYTGPTTVSGGTLLLQAANSNTAPVTVQNGGTLGGNGSVMADVTVQSGGTLSAGAAGVGQFTTTGSVTLQAGSTNWADINNTFGTNDVVAATAVNYGGTLVLNNLGAALAAGNSFKLFAAGSYTGSFAAIIPETPGAGLLWDTSGLPVSGTLKVQLGIPTTPTNITFSVSGSTLTLTWPSDYLGWTAQSNSVDVADTNFWYDIPGSSTSNSLNITVEPGTPKVFYRLRYQTP